MLHAQYSIPNVYVHHTKDEIVEMLEVKPKQLKPYFDDNLVG